MASNLTCQNNMANAFCGKMGLSLCLSFLFAIATSCAHKPNTSDFEKARKMDHYMDSWVGHYQAELISRWGPPTEVQADGQGGTILIYESLKGIWGDEKDKRIVGGLQYPTGKRQSGYAAKRSFYVNEKGIIYDWNWSGL
jgi:hypothetical protein